MPYYVIFNQTVLYACIQTASMIPFFIPSMNTKSSCFGIFFKVRNMQGVFKPKYLSKVWNLWFYLFLTKIWWKKIKCNIISNYFYFFGGGGGGGVKEIKWNTIVGKVKEGVASQVDVELKPKAMKAL